MPVQCFELLRREQMLTGRRDEKVFPGRGEKVLGEAGAEAGARSAGRQGHLGAGMVPGGTGEQEGLRSCAGTRMMGVTLEGSAQVGPDSSVPEAAHGLSACWP